MGVSWIYDTALDRRNEWVERNRPSTNYESRKIAKVFHCRYCKKSFQSQEDRNAHEAKHPVANPLMIINGKEITSSTFFLSQNVQPDNIEFVSVDYIIVNGNQKFVSLPDFAKQLSNTKKQFFGITLIGRELKKTIKIDIQIADQASITAIDDFFVDCFCKKNFSGNTVSLFIEKTQKFECCEGYREGLVSYIHGIMAKDRSTDHLSFGEFSEKLSNSLHLLSTYDTPLSQSICHLIKFVKNDFAIGRVASIPTLDRALCFFNKQDHPYEKTKATDIIDLPTDMITELVLNTFINFYDKYSLERLTAEYESLNNSLLSLQDIEKIHYICWRKASDEKNHDKQGDFARLLTHSTLIK